MIASFYGASMENDRISTTITLSGESCTDGKTRVGELFERNSSGLAFLARIRFLQRRSALKKKWAVLANERKWTRMCGLRMPSFCCKTWGAAYPLTSSTI